MLTWQSHVPARGTAVHDLVQALHSSLKMNIAQQRAVEGTVATACSHSHTSGPDGLVTVIVVADLLRHAKAASAAIGISEAAIASAGYSAKDSCQWYELEASSNCVG